MNDFDDDDDDGLLILDTKFTLEKVCRQTVRRYYIYKIDFMEIDRSKNKHFDPN